MFKTEQIDQKAAREKGLASKILPREEEQIDQHSGLPQLGNYTARHKLFKKGNDEGKRFNIS